MRLRKTVCRKIFIVNNVVYEWFLFQNLRCTEVIFTLFTFDLELTFMNSTNVTFKTYFLTKEISTIITFISEAFMNCLNMPFQIIDLRKGFFTRFALIISLAFMNSLYMNL